MRSLSAACGRQMDSPVFRRIIGAIAAVSMCGWPGPPVSAQGAASTANPPVSAEFRESVTLASKDGVLEVRLTARQGAASAALNPKLPPWLCTTTMHGQILSTSAS